jgi:two-component system cell cycle sensor histidine kinase/response regulator CckA
MKTPLKILHLENDLNDAELVQSALEADDIIGEITRVQTCRDFVSALECGSIDLILSDSDLPAFDGLTDAELVRKKWPMIPLIFVSGSLSEELLLHCFRSGATDCVPKNHLARLAPAVRRAMKEVEERAERRRLETQAIEAQKMEVISQLSCGVAHDFNNLLAIIVGCSDLINLDLSQGSRLRKYTGQIRDASNRAAGLTRQLLVFSRKQLMQTVVIDPNNLVKEEEKLLRRVVGEKIKTTIVLGEQIGNISADSSHIGQLLLNLVLNAKDAMPEGGELIIKTSNISVDEEYVRTHTGMTPGNYVMISVGDTGMGMTGEVKAHLFEPFFTTKPLGTGLGLSTCRTIVQQSGGQLEVQSEFGRGTTFKIYLPQVEESIVPNIERITATTSMPEAAALRVVAQDKRSIPKESAHRILLVEDDESIRQLTTEILVRSGYEVDVAVDGEAGWRAVQAKRYDLLITDNFMPKVTGIEMVKKLHAAQMQLPVIMATALFPQDEFTQNPWLQAIPTLLKPFKTAELLSTVKEVLSVINSDRD